MHKQLIYIAGTGRCGSTLLDLLLNNSDKIQSLGEVHRLTWLAKENVAPCTCGKPVMECTFWLSIEEEAKKALGTKNIIPYLQTKETMLIPGEVGRFASICQKLVLLIGNSSVYNYSAKMFGKSHYEAGMNSLFWYEMVRRVTGSPIIIDSTKDARRLKVLYLLNTENFKVISLIRDGRAVSASAIRREGVTMKEAANDWLEKSKKSLWTLKSIPKKQLITIKYEDLCRETESTMKKICEFLEIEYNCSMVNLSKVDIHNLGGNPMRLIKQDTDIKLDEKWKDQLSESDLILFNQIAGKMNQLYDYV